LDRGHDVWANERKLRLLAVTCCRGIWDLLPEPQRRAVETAERIAEGETLLEEDWSRITDSVEDGEGFIRWGPIPEAVTSAVCASFIDFRIHRVFNGCAEARAWSQALAQRPYLFRHPERLRQLAASGNADALEEGLKGELAASFRRHLQGQRPL